MQPVTPKTLAMTLVVTVLPSPEAMEGVSFYSAYKNLKLTGKTIFSPNIMKNYSKTYYLELLIH